jgi:hypothetical protein
VVGTQGEPVEHAVFHEETLVTGLFAHEVDKTQDLVLAAGIRVQKDGPVLVPFRRHDVNAGDLIAMKAPFERGDESLSSCHRVSFKGSSLLRRDFSTNGSRLARGYRSRPQDSDV